ncbi:MAG TPA: threonine--tRNA ligase [Thermomicrobiales bacterium]|nr:threonine--tRNA ligase [Chloroflexota bacterium]HBY45125.1 threonine--tRNA ligase [Chloroflexota bacterium]HQZ90217.1 threonine--tRNA ligase [Thermomicrobiales bacterium]HRA31355.1 threonine--tRNA ligase [Thermomicrobiales bacterium]
MSDHASVSTDIQTAVDNPEELDLARMRHSAAHVLAEAMLEIFPGAGLAIGPAIENGFYYDFELPRSLTPEDLDDIEKRMRKHISAPERFQRAELSRADALAAFAGQPYKLELIHDLPENEVISTYTNGSFVDLCRGPHVEDTGKIGAFKLMSIAGAYWRGDEKRPMLQRVYGTAWKTQEDLDAYLHQLEEARRRDHRKLGRELGLFTISDEIGAGIPIFFPKGEILRYLMEGYVRDVQTRYGYDHVWTGHIVKEELYRRSGHLEHYSDVMFPPMDDEGTVYRLKPMNCPSHMTLFNQQLHSYRELPLRYAEFATLYRYEKSGELSGLTRVRSLTQDDCHIFCTPDQIGVEFGRALDLISEILATYGMTDYRIRLSLRGEEGKYVADDDKWQQAEDALRAALDAKEVAYDPVEGEAAFYGPKADFMAKDALGREWQLSTIQVDFIQPERLGCKYIGEDGHEHTPVVIHRAVTGSTERFLGVMIEHFAGAFPVWLAPVQAIIIPIADRHQTYAESVAQRLRMRGFRVEVDLGSDRMQNKIRVAQQQKIPFMLVVGDKEAEADAVAVRLRSGENLGATPVEQFINLLGGLVDSKSLSLVE